MKEIIKEAENRSPLDSAEARASRRKRGEGKTEEEKKDARSLQATKWASPFTEAYKDMQKYRLGQGGAQGR